MSDQLLDPDVPTLASQDKLKVSPKGLPFVIYIYIYLFIKCKFGINFSRKTILVHVLATNRVHCVHTLFVTFPINQQSS